MKRRRQVYVGETEPPGIRCPRAKSVRGTRFLQRRRWAQTCGFRLSVRRPASFFLSCPTTNTIFAADVAPWSVQTGLGVLVSRCTGEMTICCCVVPWDWSLLGSRAWAGNRRTHTRAQPPPSAGPTTLQYRRCSGDFPWDRGIEQFTFWARIGGRRRERGATFFFFFPSSSDLDGEEEPVIVGRKPVDHRSGCLAGGPFGPLVLRLR